jgi:exosortase A-associated hydrolase 1
MRTLITFPCGESTLGGTFDDGPRKTGLLMVTGGTEIRVGAHGGMARLAAEVAGVGFPTLRYDRRGVGDSDGEDPGYAQSAPDIMAGVREFRRRRPDVTRIIGCGLCDGATALALHHRSAGLDGLILANPWTVEPEQGLPPPAAIKKRYAQRLLSVGGWKRLLTGKIDYRAAVRGVVSLARSADRTLSAAVASELSSTDVPIALILATGDATAIAFEREWEGRDFDKIRQSRRVAVTRVESDSHSFATDTDAQRFAQTCLAALQQCDAAQSSSR